MAFKRAFIEANTTKIFLEGKSPALSLHVNNFIQRLSGKN